MSRSPADGDRPYFTASTSPEVPWIGTVTITVSAAGPGNQSIATSWTDDADQATVERIALTALAAQCGLPLGEG